jgi:hypothetical protein
MAQRTLTLKPSSQIHGARHDPDSGTLEVDLNDGKAYAVGGVDEDLADKFESSDSHGIFYHKHLKQLPHSRIK